MGAVSSQAQIPVSTHTFLCWGYVMAKRGRAIAGNMSATVSLAPAEKGKTIVRLFWTNNVIIM